MFFPDTREQAETINVSVFFFFLKFAFRLYTQSLCVAIQSQISAI